MIVVFLSTQQVLYEARLMLSLRVRSKRAQLDMTKISTSDSLSLSFKSTHWEILAEGLNLFISKSMNYNE